MKIILAQEQVEGAPASELTFDKGVGLTPGDHYWLYVNRKTGDTISVALVAVSVGLRLAEGTMELRTALVVLLLLEGPKVRNCLLGLLPLRRTRRPGRRS